MRPSPIQRAFMMQLLPGMIMLCLAAFLLACAPANPISNSATPTVSTNSTVQVSLVVTPEETATFAAQPFTPTSLPAPSKFQSPLVNTDRTVTLLFYASNVTSVTALGDFGDLILKKDAQNIWSATTKPLEPAIYSYTFIVDGVQMADPNNPDRKGASESLVTVPGDSPMPWELRNVHHGHITQVLYFSQIFNSHRRYFVYTPPGYGDATSKLPVLYLLHGYSDDDSAWTAVGKANLIADNLLADGKIKPMLIVMPYGQLNSHVIIDNALDIDFQELYEKQLLTEIIPAVEQAFHAAPGAKHRAIAGLSMGGFQASIIGMNNPDVFSTVGVWSPAFFGDPGALLSRLVAAPDALKHSFLYVHLGVGQRDSLVGCSFTIDKFLTEQDIAHEFTLTPEKDHSWVVWRSYLADFLPKFSAVAQ